MQNRCTLEQAQQIADTTLVQLTLFVVKTYQEAYSKRFTEYSEAEWSKASALLDLFTMGYVSGVRAEREKKRQ